MSIAFEELEGSPRLQISAVGTTAVREFRVAWEDWQAFSRLLVGTYQLVGGAPLFIPPLAFPGLPNLVAAEVQVEPFDPQHPTGSGGVSLTGQTNTYLAGGARITATYRTLFDSDNRSRIDLPTVPNGTILTYAADLGSEYMTIPGRTWYWNGVGADILPEDINPGIVIPTGTYQLIWQRVPLPPWANIRALRGKVNDSTFLGAPAGTVLFLGARVTREFQFIEEGGLWRLEYAFSENIKTLSDGLTQVGWNFYYRQEPDAGEHWLEIFDESGNSPYVAGDFAELFEFTAS